MKSRLAAVLAAAALAACGPRQEKEPNDDASRATPVRAGKVQGTMGSAQDADLYRLEVAQESAVLSARLGGIKGVDFVLSVMDHERRELKRIDETAAGGDEEALDLGVGQGAYLISVTNKDERADNPGQEYTLELKLEKGLGREREPDDSPQTASPLELPGVTRGHYWPGRNLLSGDTDFAEADWYRLRIATGLFVLDLDLSGVPKVDPVVEVYDPNFYKVKEVDSGGVGEGEGLKSFGVRGPAEFLLKLSSKHRTGNPEVPYEILAELIPYQGRTEFEPNDQRIDATPFEGESVSGMVAPEGDSDWYRLAAPQDQKQLLRAQLSGVEGLDLVLKVCDSFGNPLVVVDNMGKGQPETATGLGVTQGDYFLVVSEKSGKKAAGRSAYTLTKTLVPFQPGLEFEPNDLASAAQVLKVGESMDGYIAPKGDQDHYQFNVYQKGTVVFEVAGILNVQLSAALFDQEGGELQAWTAAKAGESLAFEKSLDAGTYVLRLKAAGPEQNNVRDKYSLRLRVR